MRYFWLSGILLLLCGCVLNAPPARNSRFKADITDMQKVDFYRDTWVYRHPTKKTTDYNRFILSPFSVYENTAVKIKRANKKKFDQLATTLHQKTKILFSADYPVVESSDENTLRVEIEIIDIKPIVQLKKEGNTTVVRDPDIEGSKIEANCYDALSGELIYAVSTLYKGEPYAAYQNSLLIKNIQDAYNEWFTFFKVRFDEAMERKSNQ
jgi:Protein of unknown function (DUF3313)